MKGIKRRRGYALVEIILAIGVLAIVGMTVLQMFALASDVQRRARDTDIASARAQTIVEVYRVNGAYEQTAYFNDSWQVCDEASAQYQITTDITPDGDVDHITVTVRRYGSFAVASISGKEHDPVIFALEASVWKGGAV